MKYKKTAIIVSVLTLLTVPAAVLANQDSGPSKAAYTNSCPKGNCPQPENGIIRDMPTNQEALSQVSNPVGPAPDSTPAQSSEDVVPPQDGATSNPAPQTEPDTTPAVPVIDTSTTSTTSVQNGSVTATGGFSLSN